MYMCMDEYRETCMNGCMYGWIWADLHESMYVHLYVCICMYTDTYMHACM